MSCIIVEHDKLFIIIMSVQEGKKKKGKKNKRKSNRQVSLIHFQTGSSILFASIN